MKNRVTLLVVPVLSIVAFNLSPVWASSSPANKTTNKIVMQADQLEKNTEKKEHANFSTEILITRNTSLYDHNDGTRKDGMDYLAVPTLTTSIGLFKAKIAYSQNLIDSEDIDSGLADIPLIYSFITNKWMWSTPYILTLTPFTSVVIPASKRSIKKDQLQTAFSVGVSFGIQPDGISPLREGVWSLAIGLTAGRYAHAYDTDIQGAVLNRYSSNQTLNLGYTYKQISFSVEYINKLRWTYQENLKNSFEHSEELGYALNDQCSLVMGHTNGGSALRANAADSNLDLINENDSLIYLGTGFSF